MIPPRSLQIAFFCLLAGTVLAGCGTGNFQPAAEHSAAAAPVLRGNFHGGQQPVSGTLVRLYAVGNTADGSASTQLLTQPVYSDANGNFDFTGLWSCKDTATYGPDPLLYLVGTGGNPGLGSGKSNPALAMMAAIGRCSTLTAQTFVTVNELTTVAAVYSLAPFMADYAHLGAAGNAALANAFLTSQSLANTGNGRAPGPALAAGGGVPLATLNTLADVLAPCINSDGTGAGCAQLFAAATSPAGTVPADTIAATLAIAREPARNVAALYGLVDGSAPFQPTLTAMPADWTMALRYTGGGLAGPAGLAVDGSGNVWVANSTGAGVTGLTNNGVRLTGLDGETAGGTLFGAQGIAIDRTGNVWVADTLLSTVVRLGVTAGGVTARTTFSSGLDGPTGIAVDSRGEVWVANYTGGSVAVLDGGTGALLYGSPLTANGTLGAPAAVALDTAGNAWVSDNQAGTVVQFSPTGTLLSGPGYTDNALLAPLGLALGSGATARVAGNGNDSLALLSAASAGAPVGGGGLVMPVGVALDNAGTAWVTSAGGALTRVSGAAATGALGTLPSAAGVAVDASGNVWAASPGDDSVYKFVGLAHPATVPLAAVSGP